MLVNVRSDSAFQRYLDREEQKLFRQLVPILTAAVNIQINTNGVKATDYIVKRAQPILLKHYRRIYADQFRAVSTAAPVPVEKAAGDPGISEFMRAQQLELERRAGSQIRGIAESQRSAIAASVLRMTGEGKNNNQIARAIGDIAPHIGRTRAATIARTETHSSALKAIDQTIRAKKKLKVTTKTWWANLDSRVRETHADAHEQVKPADEPFEVGDSELMFPGDDSLGADEGEIINCRCSVLYETGDEEEEPGEGVGQEEEEEEDEEWPEKLEKEQNWHDDSFSTAPNYITAAVEKTLPLLDVTSTGRTKAYQSPSETAINMGKSYSRKSGVGQTIWRHEYGHHIDNQEGRQMGLGQYGYWSQTLRQEQLEDWKTLTAIKPSPEEVIDKRVLAYTDRHYDLTEEGGKMTKLQATRHLLGEIFTGDFTADDFLAFTREGGATGVMDTFRAAVRLDEGHITEAIRNIRRLDVSPNKEIITRMLADYLGALTKNKVGFGHTKSYYTKADRFTPPGQLNRNQGTEMVANYIALAGANDPVSKAAAKLVEKYAPKTWAAIAARVREIAKRKPKKKAA